MAYRKRPKRSRKAKRAPRTYRRKRMGAKGGNLRLVRWSSATTGNTHAIITGSDIIFSGTSSTVFQMAHVNGFSEMVSLFDNYRITKVMYRWVITRNPDQATTTGNKGIYPRLVWTHDFNDSNFISRDLIYQRSNMKEAYFSDNKQLTRWYTLKPSVLSTVYEGIATTAYSPKWLQWLDTSDSSTNHYGIKYAWDSLYTGINCNLEAKIFFECKGIS